MSVGVSAGAGVVVDVSVSVIVSEAIRICRTSN